MTAAGALLYGLHGAGESEQSGFELEQHRAPEVTGGMAQVPLPMIEHLEVALDEIRRGFSDDATLEQCLDQGFRQAALEEPGQRQSRNEILRGVFEFDDLVGH